MLDIQKIVELGKEYHSSIEKIPYEYIPSYVAQSLAEYIQMPNNIIYLAIDDGEVVGILWGIATPVLPWTPTVSAIDILFYVRESYRGTYTAMKLIKAYELWAKEKGCVEALLGTSSGIQTERTLRFYDRMGYILTGHQSTKEL